MRWSRAFNTATSITSATSYARPSPTDSTRKFFRCRRWKLHGRKLRNLPSASTSLRTCAIPASFGWPGWSTARTYRLSAWTVDEPADLEFVRRVYAEFVGRHSFGLQEILDLLQRKPDVRRLQGEFIANEGYYKTLYQQAAAGAAPKRPLQRSQAWLARAEKVIPGTAQTFSKGRSQYVQGVSPIFLQRGQGCRVWDVDCNEYIDYVQGLLPNILGYAHAEVNAAFAAQAAEGHSFSLPHPLEVELAERLCRLIPWRGNGAFRQKRLGCDRRRRACGPGVHRPRPHRLLRLPRLAGLVHRQYLTKRRRADGRPRLTHPFAYNDAAKLEATLAAHPGEFAAVIMEPVNFVEPSPGYLPLVKELTHRHGALLIFDEICSGFHFGLGGAQKMFGVTPDLAAFGKAMGNGFPIACIVGRADVMKVFEEIFVSFTFAGEVAGMAAAMKVLDLLEGTDALARMEHHGKRLQAGFNTLAKATGLADRLQCVGYPHWSLLKFKDAAGKDCMLTRSLYSQEVVRARHPPTGDAQPYGCPRRTGSRADAGSIRRDAEDPGGLVIGCGPRPAHGRSDDSAGVPSARLNNLMIQETNYGCLSAIRSGRNSRPKSNGDFRALFISR